MAQQWYVLRTKPHKERMVHQLLQTEEIEVFFPSYRVDPVNPRAAKVRPYFPGYMFVHLDLEEEGDNVLRWTPGTRGLVRFGNIPATVPPALIRKLKDYLANLTAEDLEKPGVTFAKGDKIRIIDGPFEGYEGIFDTRLSGKDRVRVLLALLNRRPQHVQLDVDDIEKVED